MGDVHIKPIPPTTLDPPPTERFRVERWHISAAERQEIRSRSEGLREQRIRNENPRTEQVLNYRAEVETNTV